MSECTYKYTARHVINIPAGTGQAGKAPGSRLTNLSSSLDRRKFLLYNYYYKNKNIFIFSQNIDAMGGSCVGHGGGGHVPQDFSRLMYNL